MRHLKSQKYPGYLTYQLFMSPAFRALKPAAKDMLIQIYFEIQYPDKKKKKTRQSSDIVNRNDIRLTYREIKTRLGYSDKTIWASFKQIMAHGFIKVIKYGGGSKGDYQIYAICEDWRKWEPDEVIHELRPRPEGKRWQKKISSNEGKAPHSTGGKPLLSKQRGSLPTGKAVGM